MKKYIVCVTVVMLIILCGCNKQKATNIVIDNSRYSQTTKADNPYKDQQSENTTENSLTSMEANAVEINLGCAGSGYTLACGKVHPIIEEQQNQYRVLSLSAVPNSPIMWAHYADCYSGCCLIYSTEKSFSEVEPVIYTDLTFGLSDAEFPGDGIDDLSEAIKESLRFKHKDWAYENEWRLIQHENAGFLNYESSEFLGIILGENMNRKKATALAELCKSKNIPCFRTYTMKSWNEIAFAPYDFIKSLGGKKYEYITPNEMKNDVVERSEKGQCASNEEWLFDELNRKVLLNHYY